jgi:hypothetical protein
MDSPENIKKTHFSIDTLNKFKTSSCVIKAQKEELVTAAKRSASYIIPKRFVPKLKPKKALINPTFLKLNENNNVHNSTSADDIETKSVNDDDISFSSFSESISDLDEEENLSNLDEEILHDDNDLKLIKKEDTNINKGKNKNSSLSLLSIRKKLAQIKNSSFASSIKECIDENVLNLKKKFSLDEDEIFLKKNFCNYNNDNNNLCKYNSSILYCNDKNNMKGNRPFLIFDVLVKASNKNNICK